MMHATRVKICGITRPEDARLAAELGADAIGLNFVGGPRRLAEAQSRQIYWAIHDDDAKCPHVDLVALIDIEKESPEEPWRGHCRDFPYDPDVWQLYGAAENMAKSHWFLGPENWWFVSAMANRDSIVDLQVALEINQLTPKGIVLDTAAPCVRGGSGKVFNWNWIAEARVAGELEGLPPIILAGGLTPENVAEAIRIVRPWAVDVASGVEVAGRPGVKDPIKMRDFIQAAKGA